MNSYLASNITNSTSQVLQPFSCIKFTGFTASDTYGALAGPDDDVVGVVFEPIPRSGTGAMVMMGVVTNVNTKQYPAGTALYCGPNGYLTDSVYGLQIATVLSQHVNGAVFVNTLSVPQQSAGLTGGGAINQISYWTGANTVGGNANIKINPTIQGLDLGAGQFSGLLGPIVLLNNQPTPQLLLSYPLSGNEDMVLTYSVVRDGKRTVGEMVITSTPTEASIMARFGETNPLNIIFSVQLNAGNVQIYYTTPNSGFNANFRYSFKRWGGA
jgi:hypothetical protein